MLSWSSAVRRAKRLATHIPMKGRNKFDANEADEIRARLRDLRAAAPGSAQKLIRDELRAHGFYISDWPRDGTGFTVADFDELVLNGQITIKAQRVAFAPVGRSPSGKAGSRRSSSEADPYLQRAAPVSPAKVDELAEQALRALDGAAHALDTAADRIPHSPGLYAIHGSAAKWRELGLGKPPDTRPLYIGKAEDSLATRDVTTHFGDGRTGSSTVRRSIASLLHDSLDLRGIPRNPDNPGYFANYGLSDVHDGRLTAWMRRHLRLAIWPKPPGTALLTVERALLVRRRPPLNLKDIETPWSEQLSSARRQMADEARVWARERGHDA